MLYGVVRAAQTKSTLLSTVKTKEKLSQHHWPSAFNPIQTGRGDVYNFFNGLAKAIKLCDFS